MWKTILGAIFLIAVFGYLYLVVNRIPTISDARASRLIWDEVMTESQKAGLTIGKDRIFENPSRGSTAIIVQGAVSEKERQTLSEVVENVGRRHPDRKLVLKFQ